MGTPPQAITAQLFNPPFKIPVLLTLPAAGRQCGEMVAISVPAGFSFYVWDCRANQWVALVFEGSTTPTVTVLPPSPPNGNTTIILVSGGNHYSYVWNSVSNSWVLITVNNYVNYPSGPNRSTDDVGAITFIDFSDRNMWLPVGQTAQWTLNFAAGYMTVATPGGGVPQIHRIFTGIVCGKRIQPNLAGIIEVEMFFDNVGAPALDAYHYWSLGFFIGENTSTTSHCFNLVGMRKRDTKANGFFVSTNWNPAEDNVDIEDALTSTMANPVTSFKMRFVIKWRFNGALWTLHNDQKNILYSYNGGAYNVMGGVPGTRNFANGILNSNPGFNWGFGFKNGYQDFVGAQTFGRLTQCIVHQGSLHGY